MKTQAFLLMLAFAISTLFVAESEARSRNGRIRNTQKRQMNRIRQGAQSGSLTKKETRGLVRQQKRINRGRKQALADDGKVDNQERKQLRKRQARANRKIFRQKHDGQTQEGQEAQRKKRRQKRRDGAVRNGDSVETPEAGPAPVE